MAGALTVSRADVAAWFELILADQAVIESLGNVREATAEAKDAALPKYRFPAAIEAKFPSLQLYAGTTVGVGEGGRGSGSAEKWACICSLAIQTLVVNSFHASQEGNADAVEAAVKVATQYQKFGPKIFGVPNPPRPLSSDDVIAWGRSCCERAPTPETMGASYLTMVIHDLTKMKSLKEPLAAKHPDLNEESLTAKFVEEVVNGEWPGSAELVDILGCDAGMRSAMMAGFMTGFNASQVMQGESTAVDLLRMTQFLNEHPGSDWFVDHYMLDTAGILGKPHAFTGTIIVEGYTFELYSRFIDDLVKGKASPVACVKEYQEYHNFRVGLVARCAHRLGGVTASRRQVFRVGKRGNRRRRWGVGGFGGWGGDVTEPAAARVLQRRLGRPDAGACRLAVGDGGGAAHCVRPAAGAESDLDGSLWGESSWLPGGGCGQVRRRAHAGAGCGAEHQRSGGGRLDLGGPGNAHHPSGVLASHRQ